MKENDYMQNLRCLQGPSTKKMVKNRGPSQDVFFINRVKTEFQNIIVAYKKLTFSFPLVECLYSDYNVTSWRLIWLKMKTK